MSPNSSGKEQHGAVTVPVEAQSGLLAQDLPGSQGKNHCCSVIQMSEGL